jgi:hypothetical protein
MRYACRPCKDRGTTDVLMQGPVPCFRCQPEALKEYRERAAKLKREKGTQMSGVKEGPKET